MTRGKRSVLALVFVAIAVAALVAGPACPVTAQAQPPAQGQLLPDLSTPTSAPPMSSYVEIAATKRLHATANVAYNTQLDEYLVVWLEPRAIWGRRVTNRGELVGEPFLLEDGAPNGYSLPHGAYDSQRNRYLVVWLRLGVSGNSDLHGRFVPARGPDAAMTAFLIYPSLSNAEVGSPVYASSRDTFFLVWSEYAPGTLRRVTWGGRIIPGGLGALPPFPLAQHATDNRRHPDVAYNLKRNECLVAVDDGEKANENIYGTRLTAGGTVMGGGEFTIADWPDDESSASVAACPASDQYLVAWHSIRNSDLTHNFYARFVSGDGSPGPVVELGQRGSWDPAMTDAACGVTNQTREEPRYLVAWAESTGTSRSCYAREVFPAGTMTEAVRVGVPCHLVAVAGGAMNWLAVTMSGSKVFARIVGNTTPRARFTVTPREGYSTTDFQFDASGCTDATDSPGVLQVRWDWNNDGFYDTAWSATKTASHQFQLADWQSIAVLRVRLQVTDGRGATDEATDQVTVYNAPPSAQLEVDPAMGNTATTFRFDASRSSDPEGGALQVRWDWRNDGTFDTDWGTDWQPEVTFPTPGTYWVCVQVRDNWEQTNGACRQVTVKQGTNSPPSAAFSIAPSSGDTTTLFAFDASGSTDAEDGAPSEFRWDWQDDGTFDTAWSASAQATHTFAAAGSHTVRLEVRDSEGLTDDATRTALVAEPGALEQIYLPLVLRAFQ